MSTIKRITLPSALLAASVLAACGGDAAAPGPQSPTGAPPSSAAPSEPAAGDAGAADPAAPADPAAQAPASGNAPAAAAAPPAQAGAGNIVGMVTATPAKANSNVVVYLEDATAATDKQPTAVIDQRKMSFSPFVTAIPVGGKVVFRNDDPFPHNIFSPDHEKFDLGTMAQGGARVHVFKTPGQYTLLCNMHPGMLAYIEVVPSIYYALTDKNGKFTLKNVPAGAHKLAAWGPKLAPVSQPVNVTTGDVTVNLELHRGS